MPRHLLETIQSLAASAESLAAIGAMLTLRRSGETAHPAVAAHLAKVLEAIDPKLLAASTADEEQAALDFIHATFRGGLDVIEAPGRDPGWTSEDPVVLQSQAYASRLIARTISAAAASTHELKLMLSRKSRLLDIGTGAGWLAIEAAQTWPNLDVLGIDIHAPSLSLARQNIAAAGLDGRITLSEQGVDTLVDRDAFDIVSFPGQFIAEPLVRSAVSRSWEALRPGGYLAFSITSAQSVLGEALAALSTVRSGGHPWSAPAVTDLLAEAGFTGIEVVAPKGLAVVVMGRKPR